MTVIRCFLKCGDTWYPRRILSRVSLSVSIDSQRDTHTNLAPRDGAKSTTVRCSTALMFSKAKRRRRQLNLDFTYSHSIITLTPLKGRKTHSVCVYTVFTHQAEIKCSTSLIRRVPVKPPPPCLWTDKSCCPLSYDPHPTSFPPTNDHLRGIRYAKHPHQRMDGRSGNLLY